MVALVSGLLSGSEVFWNCGLCLLVGFVWQLSTGGALILAEGPPLLKASSVRRRRSTKARHFLFSVLAASSSSSISSQRLLESSFRSACRMTALNWGSGRRRTIDLCNIISKVARDYVRSVAQRVYYVVQFSCRC